MKFETYHEDYADETLYLPVPFSSKGFVDLAEQITVSLRDRSKRYRECDDIVSMIIHDNESLRKILEILNMAVCILYRRNSPSWFI